MYLAKSMNKSERRKESMDEDGKESMDEDGVDLISNLPDPVLALVLEGLPSTKESIRTSILSRRWRYLWTSVPSIDLEYRGGRKPSEEKSKFKNIVDRALLKRFLDLDIDSFRLSCSDYYSTSTLEQWILLAVIRNVLELDLRFWPKEESESESEDMVMPECLVTCDSLQVLRLSLGSRLILPSFSGFPALTVLKLFYVELLCDDDLVEYILECPLLEELTLVDCRLDKLDLLCISCPNLKKLSLSYMGRDDLCGCLKISCPNLVFLEIEGHAASNYIFEGLNSLKEVVIDPQSNGLLHLFHAISRLFRLISHVESLSTALYFLYKCIDDEPDLGLPNLKNLELTTMNNGETVKGLKKVLKICPKLESLVFNVENVHTYEEEAHNYDEAEYPKLDGVGTMNLTPDVAWVEFFELNGEKPKLSIDWDDDDDSKWCYVHAKWGNEANFSD